MAGVRGESLPDAGDYKGGAMHAERILFPTDFSPASESALGWATSLARDTGARLLIVHVEEPPTPYVAGEYAIPEATTPAQNELAKLLAHVVPSDESVTYEHRLLLGDPAPEIVQLAKEENADLIVMGTHGRTGLSRLLMGSVAEHVVRRAACPVLTIRQPHTN